MAHGTARSLLKHLLPLPIAFITAQAPDYPTYEEYSFVDEHKLEVKGRVERVRVAGMGGPGLFIPLRETFVPELIEEAEQL